MSDFVYVDEDVYRTGSDPNIEVSRARHDAGAIVVSIDSWDAPEASIRLRGEQVEALRAFLNAMPS